MYKMQTKLCDKCLIRKDKTEFYIRKDGNLSFRCISCCESSKKEKKSKSNKNREKRWKEKQIMGIVYCLQLQDNKYYVGYTENFNRRILEHIEGKGAKWTGLYGVNKVLEIHLNGSYQLENEITLQYMKRYGIPNVRGGSWCSIILDIDKISKLIYNE